MKTIRITLTPRVNEIIEASDFVVIKDETLAIELVKGIKGLESLRKKIIIIAPEGIEFCSIKDLNDAIAQANLKRAKEGDING